MRADPRDTETYRRLRVPLRGLLARALPGPLAPSRSIIVAGLPRSGTSWIAKTLSLAGGVSYYFEPDRELSERYRYLYLPAGRRDEELELEIRRMLRGRVCGDDQIAEKGLRDLLLTPFRDTVLLKWVWLSLALAGIGERFPQLRVVQVLRHPVPQFLSWRERGWSPVRALRRLLDQEALVAGPLAPHRAALEAVSDFWEAAGAFWGATASLQLAAHRPGWVLREHEWFCLDPEQRMAALVEELGLSWRASIGEFLSPQRSLGRGPGYGGRRDPRSEVHKWEGRVAAPDLERVKRGLERFGLPFYRDLDPEAFHRSEVSGLAAP